MAVAIENKSLEFQTKSGFRTHKTETAGHIEYSFQSDLKIPNFSLQYSRSLHILIFQCQKKSLLRAARSKSALLIDPGIKRALHSQQDSEQKLSILDPIFDSLTSGVLLGFYAQFSSSEAQFPELDLSISAIKRSVNKQRLVRKMREKISQFSPFKSELLLLALILVMSEPIPRSDPSPGLFFVYDSILPVFYSFERVAPTERRFINLMSLAIEAETEQEWNSPEIQEITGLFQVYEQYWHGLLTP